MSYEEGTVGHLIEELNKIKDKNKKVYWVETQYDEYDCYGDGFTTIFHLVDGFGEEAIKDGIVLGGERVEYGKEPLSVYSLSEIGTVILSTKEQLRPDSFVYRYEGHKESLKIGNDYFGFDGNVKVVTGHCDFKDFVVEMTPEQCYNYLRENNLGYMEEDDGNL